MATRSAKAVAVEVCYKGGIDLKKDRELERLAAKHGGHRTGSGCLLIGDGERDVSFEFKDVGSARLFCDKVGIEAALLG